MSDCNFNLPFQEPVSNIIAKAKAAIENYNGTFNGDETSGDFAITVYGNTIKGSYTVTGQVLNLIITHKPFFVPCSTIENLLVKEISK
jgi:hypothetical protein